MRAFLLILDRVEPTDLGTDLRYQLKYGIYVEELI